MKKSKNTNRRGFIFIYAYLLIVLFMVYELALLTYFAQNINAFERFSNNTIAYQLAEAGLDSAMAKLKNDSIVFDANGNYTETRNFILGNYNVTVSNQQEDLDGDGALDGPLAPNTFRITTLASAPAVSNPARPIQQATNVVAYVRKEENPLFEYAVFAENMDMASGSTGLIIDSYDSRNGPYDPDTASSNGDIGTDSTLDNRIALGNTPANPTIVYGDAVVGPGGDPNKVICVLSGSKITGTLSAASFAKNYQTIATNLPSSGNLHIKSVAAPYVFPAGQYHFDSIRFDQDTTITTTGPVEIYVDGVVRIDYLAKVNAGGTPPNFVIYATGGAPFWFDDKTTFKGAIYAPKSLVHLKSEAEFSGAVVARAYAQSNGGFHYDEALKDISGGQGAKMNLVSWRTVPIESNSTDSSS